MSYDATKMDGTVHDIRCEACFGDPSCEECYGDAAIAHRRYDVRTGLWLCALCFDASAAGE